MFSKTKRHFSVFTRLSTTFAFMAIAMLCACSDGYDYDDSEPDFLGGSIYECLQTKGDFTYYLRLVNDLDYGKVLSLTGSKTIFPATDEAFERFFQNNIYGVHSYDQLTTAQKRSLLNSSMVNMTYLTDMLSNAVLNSSSSNGGEGVAIRRPSSYTYLDSIEHISAQDANFSAKYWTRFNGKGIYVVDDNTDPYIVHFTPQHTATNNINESDLSLILGTNYSSNDVYINGVKVIEPNITCKNGYVHVMNDVLTPNRNMSQIIAMNGQTLLFNKLMNRFSAPYFNSSVNDIVHQLYTGQEKSHPLITDSIFVKQFFTTNNPTDPQGNDMTSYGLLYFSPSNNSYSSMSDMGVMFVPTDAAMNDYINSSKGRYLKDAYGSWENVPTNLMALFIRNHQKKSFMSSLPSMWPTMNDESSFAMHVSQGDVLKSYIGSNGVVYITNKVYPPIDYQCVYASVLTSADTKIMNWALQDSRMKFNLYLRSMENMYNLLVPTDEALQNYRDPLSWAKGKSSRQIWAFKYDATKDNPVSADVYSVNDDGSRGSYLRTIDDISIIRNRLTDICDRHIIVGNMDDKGNMSGYIDDGTMTFAQSKGGSTLTINGNGDNFTITGGGDKEQGMAAAHLVTRPLSALPDKYDSDNGRTYFINSVLQDPTKSVYTNLGEHSEYSKFFELLNGNDQVFTYFQKDSEIKSIFTLNKTSQSSGLGDVVSSFSNFRYTVFVPTNDAVDAAFSKDTDLHTWTEIAEQDDATLKRKWAIHLIRFLKYHFMDNSIYLSNKPFINMYYETAARNDYNKFQKLTVGGDGSNLSITDAHGNVAHVVKKAGLYNLQGRDFIVNSNDYRTATQIVSSSFSVIHLIDHALMPE